MSEKPQRRWFQFSLKTLLVGMTVLCIGPGGYVAYEQAKARREKGAVEAIEKLGGHVDYDRDAPIRSAMMRQILGDESFGNVQLVYFDGSEVTDAGLAPISNLKVLRDLSLRNTRVTDAGLVHLTGLKDLTQLGLENTKVTAAGVAELQKVLPNCRIDTQQRKEFSPSDLELSVELPGEMTPNSPVPNPNPAEK